MQHVSCLYERLTPTDFEVVCLNTKHDWLDEIVLLTVFKLSLLIWRVTGLATSAPWRLRRKACSAMSWVWRRGVSHLCGDWPNEHTSAFDSRCLKAMKKRLKSHDARL